MEITTLRLNIPCRSCGHYRFRMEAARRDECPVICARCGHCAGRWSDIRANGLAEVSEDLHGLFTRMFERTPRRRR